VLLSRHDYLLIGLELSAISAIRVAGYNRRITYQQHEKFVNSDGVWVLALNQLDQLLAASKHTKNTELRIILASDFVRYLTLSAHKSITRQSDKEDFARASFREIYGKVVDDWHIQCDDAAPNLNSVVIAVDKKLIENLNNLANKYNLQLASVKPYLMVVFNRALVQSKLKEFCFAIVESNRLLFARVRDGSWQEVRNLPLESNWLVQIENIVQRETLKSDAVNERLLMIYAPNHKVRMLPVIDGWNVERLDIKSTWSTDFENNLDYTILDAA
jgi:hypothetical protein